MGSPITFSGFNSIDFNQILNAVMAQEQVPYDRLQTQQSTLKTQDTQYSTLAGKLTSFQSSIDALKADKSLAFVTSTSSDSGVGVTSTGGTVTGTYEVSVTQLARAQVTTATTSFGATTDVVGTSSSLVLHPADGSGDTTITLTGSTTLQGLADLINAETDSPASATVVQTSPGVYKLVLTGRETGTTNAFTITSNTLAGGTTPTFIDTDLDGISGDSAADNTQDALNATLTVNGLAVTSASNTVTDVIAGVTLQLLTQGATSTVRVDRDTSSAKNLLRKFINSYNDITTFAKDQATAASKGSASIGRDPLLKGLRDQLRSAALGQYGTGSLTRLAEIGVGFDQSGKMVLDDAVFDNAISVMPTDVQDLVSGATGDGGVFGDFSTMIDDYTKSGGLVASMRDRISTQVSAMSTRLDDMSAQLELRRQSLQAQYTAADLAMTRLKSQSAQLSSAGGGYRLF